MSKEFKPTKPKLETKAQALEEIMSVLEERDYRQALCPDTGACVYRMVGNKEGTTVMRCAVGILMHGRVPETDSLWEEKCRVTYMSTQKIGRLLEFLGVDEVWVDFLDRCQRAHDTSWNPMGFVELKEMYKNE